MNFLIKVIKTTAVGVGLLTLAACDGTAKLGSAEESTVVMPAGTTIPATMNIVETAVSAGSFNTLAALLQATGLDAVLADEARTYTVFAPTDEAFAALGSDTLAALQADTDKLKDILLYHVIPGSAVDAQTAISLAGGTVDAANQSALAVSLRGSDLYINDSKVISTDIAATNGVIHVIDAVLMPGDADDGQTVVVENDAGEGNTGNSDDNNADQGGEESHNLVNLVDTAVAAGNFNTLAAALAATGLDTVLADESTHYTVFAPTDEAFAALGDDAINALLGDPDTLKNILLYHVISGQSVDAKAAVSIAGSTVEAANGDKFALSLNDDNLYVNQSLVTATDVFASNGVIHVIDTVLTPPAPIVASGSVVDVAVVDGRFTTLVAALQATQLDAVLADHDTVFTVFAPTDDAFNLLGEDTINALLGDLPTLSNILLTHVISGVAIDSIQALAATGTAVETASGVAVHLSIRDGALFVNDSKVIITDILAANGIIHVVDAVIQ